jgi:hypothetical protein
LENLQGLIVKKLSDYLNESEFAAENPVTGDVFAINIREECLVESVVLEHAEDGIVIAADEKMLEIFESYGITVEDVCMECGLTECECSHVHEDNIEYAEEEPQPNPGEYDEEGDMAKTELHTMIRAARKLIGMLDNDDNMPEWTQKKITKATDYVDTAADYIASQKERGVMERFAKDPGKLDLSANPTKSQVWARYMEIYDYEGYQGEENSQEMQDLEDYAAQRFGQDMVNDMMKAGYYSYFGRPDDPKKPIDQGSGNYTGLGRSPVSDKDIKKSGTLNKRATADTKDRILSRLGKHPKPALPEGQSEETSPVARAVLHRIMMAHPGVLATHGPERVMSAVDELADRVNIGPDDEIGTSDVSGWVRDVIRMLSELPDESMSDVDRLEEQGVLEGSSGEELANEVYAEFERMYPNLARRANERMIHAAVMDVLNYGGDSDPAALAQDVARAVKRDIQGVAEAEYQGRKVTLNKPMANTDGASKSKVYVKDPKTGNVKKVTFGDPDMKIKKSNPERRKSFRARHKCDTAKDKTTARYWSCRAW